MQSLLSDFRLSVAEQNLGVYGIHVHQRGKELAAHQFRCNDRVQLFSGSKTFTSMAIGIAESEGRLSLGTSALEFFTEYKDIAQPGSELITIEDLLHMASGHATPGFNSDESTHNTETDWVELFFREPMATPAGSVFFYENMCTYMLSRIISAVCGCTLREYLLPRIFAPLGIANPQWNACPKGYSLGAVGLQLKTEEFSRLGVMMLNNGIYNDKEIVGPEYIRKAVNNTIKSSFGDLETSAGYGYQLWRCTVPNSYRADGKYGQFCVALPDYEAVVTITSHNECNTNDILRAVWKDILPKL